MKKGIKFICLAVVILFISVWCTKYNDSVKSKEVEYTGFIEHDSINNIANIASESNRMLLTSYLTNNKNVSKFTAMENRASDNLEYLEDEVIENINYVDLDVPNSDNSMKTYMSYKAITNKSSKQWKLQQSATTNDEGFRMYNDLYMIALGTYYSPHAGIEFEIEFDTGKVIKCITGDIKSNRHTDKTNRYIERNGNVVEFIIDKPCIDPLSKKMGDMSYSDMKGDVVRITRVDRETIDK